jgi:GNAT superfamily N-acetyltransferase
MKSKDTLTFSPSESARFGLSVFRGKVNGKLSTSVLLESRADLVIVRQHAGTPPALPFIFPQIHADTLAYYTCDLKSLPVYHGRQDLALEIVLPTQKDMLQALAREIFRGYQGHYQASPYISPQAIGEGYGEWASTFCHSDQTIAWLARKNGQLAGFAACSFDSLAQTCEGVLFGVHPQFQRQGIYAWLLEATRSYFQQKGFHTMVVSTQVRHATVQQVWAKAGFRFSHAVDTFHVYPLLSIPAFYTTLHTGQSESAFLAGLPGQAGATIQWTWLQPFVPSIVYEVQFAFPPVKNNLGFSVKVARVYQQDHFLCALVYWYERADDPIQ